jgi:hypothetical protein
MGWGVKCASVFTARFLLFALGRDKTHFRLARGNNAMIASASIASFF